MVDPITIFAFAASIAALISGFRDGKVLFREWWQKRKGKKRLEPQHKQTIFLEESSFVLQREYDEGCRRFGNRFVQGDGEHCLSSTLKPMLMR